MINSKLKNGKTLNKVLNNGKEPEQYIDPSIKDSINFFNKKIKNMRTDNGMGGIPKGKANEFNQAMKGLDRQYKKAGVKNPNRKITD